MPTTISFLGHATFLVEAGEKTLLIDPFFTDNPQAVATADEVEADVIVLTHGHGDHVGDTVAIAKRTGALCIANYEICSWLNGQGVENTHPQHIGGAFQHDFGRLKFTIAHHGSMLPDGSNGGNPAGLLFSFDDGNLYVAGDTGLFLDMQLIGEIGIQTAILPIGDNFTMGPEDAARAADFLKAERVIPCHYNTWPPIEQDVEAWAELLQSTTVADAVVLQPGESTGLNG